MDKTSNTPIYGLVLSGGKSTRMGMDKGNITYHSKPQREYLYELLDGICEKTFLSIRADQVAELKGSFEFIVDRNEYRGPFNGLLSAHKEFPEAAWLVLACDIPLIDRDTLEFLISNRKPGAVATAFATRKSGLPEPLAAIWEPNGLKLAIDYMSEAASSCPRKFLLKNNAALVYPENDLLLYNANSMEDYHEIRSKISG